MLLNEQDFIISAQNFLLPKKRETMRPCVTQAGDTYLRGLPLTSLIGEKFDQQLTSSY